jgi:hypothetical protein
MCLGVYLASDVSLDLIPFRESAPSFNVTELEPFEAGVRQILTREFVYAPGAHTKCGCGFRAESDDKSERVAGSRRELSAYVADAMKNGGVELYTCWNGDAGAKPTRVLELSPEELQSRDDWLIEGTLVRMRS